MQLPLSHNCSPSAELNMLTDPRGAMCKSPLLIATDVFQLFWLPYRIKKIVCRCCSSAYHFIFYHLGGTDESQLSSFEALSVLALSPAYDTFFCQKRSFQSTTWSLVIVILMITVIINIPCMLHIDLPSQEFKTCCWILSLSLSLQAPCVQL